MQSKPCNKCGVEKPLEEFHNNKNRPDGKSTRCKECAQAHYKSHKEEWAVRRKRWYDENVERYRETNKAWNNAHKDFKKQYDLEYRRKNADYFKNRKINREAVIEAVKKRAQLKRNAPGRHTKQQLKDKLDYYGGKCWICGDIATEFDHVKPIAKGGSNWLANMRPICSFCNGSKRHKWYGISGLGKLKAEILHYKSIPMDLTPKVRRVHKKR